MIRFWLGKLSSSCLKRFLASYCSIRSINFGKSKELITSAKALSQSLALLYNYLRPVYGKFSEDILQKVFLSKHLENNTS